MKNSKTSKKKSDKQKLIDATVAVALEDVIMKAKKRVEKQKVN